MAITERSRRAVAAALARLEDAYGPFPVREEDWEHPSTEYEAIRERLERGGLGGAGAWVANDDGAVLLIRDEDRSGWGDPGGTHEPGESLPETARREVREETGVECALTGVLEARITEHVDENRPDRPPIVRVIVLFEAVACSGAPDPRDGEIAAARWWERHPEDLMYDAIARYPIPHEP